MADQNDSLLEELESQLEGAERSLSAVETLDERQAERLGDRMDRLASQLLEVSDPPAIESVHEELGVTPVAPEELDALRGVMAPADGEG